MCVGWFLVLDKLRSITNKSSISLHTDGSQGVFQNISKPEIKGRKKRN